MRQLFAFVLFSVVLGLTGCTQPKASTSTKVATKPVDTKVETPSTKPADTKPEPAKIPVKEGEKAPVTPPK